MKDENEFEVRRNRYGDVDMSYYVTKAHALRDEAMRDLFRSAWQWMTQALGVARQQDRGKPRPDTAQSGWPWVDLILRGSSDRTPHHS